MLKSMTGYGKGESSSSSGKFTVEIKSVNHRYGEISVRLPRSLYSLESELKRRTALVLKRGKIDVSVQWEEVGYAAGGMQIDTAAARSYYELYSALAKEFTLPLESPLSFILSQKGIIKEAASMDSDLTELQEQLYEALDSAISAIDAMRTREGAALFIDLADRRLQISKWTEHIAGRTPIVVTEYRTRLKGRLEAMLEGVDMDESRLAQEVAILADRCDITEELVRLNSHFAQFDDTLNADEPVGRKLDFMMQELNREVNTIGSKSSDNIITSLVIQIKAEMEKMREQVQNVE